MNTYQKLLALLLAITMLFSVAACGSRAEPSDNLDDDTLIETEGQGGEYFFVNLLAGTDPMINNFPKYVDQVQEHNERNEDTVGWLEIPGTTIDDVVVCYNDPNDLNEYYYRRNFEKNYSLAGIFYADFRSDFGDGTADAIPRNTVIYGHTLSEDWNGVMFAPLKYFTDEEFARETPYIHFSTMSEDLVFEVFSVFYATVNLAYNHPNLNDAQFTEIVNECIERSIYNYDTQVGPNDKIITLSTCTYTVPGKGNVGYPNDYRYVVMGKLVDKRDATRTEAAFTANPSPKAP